MNLRNELEGLKKRGSELQYIYDSHVDHCKLQQHGASSAIAKSNGQNSQPQQQMLQQQQPKVNRSRPSSLPLSNIYSNNNASNNNQVNNIVVATTSDSLIPIQTPSNGLSFALDSLDSGLGAGLMTPGYVPGLSGLTPLLTPQGFAVVSNPSSCGGQQRNENIVSSPESGAPPKLVSL